MPALKIRRMPDLSPIGPLADQHRCRQQKRGNNPAQRHRIQVEIRPESRQSDVDRRNKEGPHKGGDRHDHNQRDLPLIPFHPFGFNTVRSLYFPMTILATTG